MLARFTPVARVNDGVFCLFSVCVVSHDADTADPRGVAAFDFAPDFRVVAVSDGTVVAGTLVIGRSIQSFAVACYRSRTVA